MAPETPIPTATSVLGGSLGSIPTRFGQRGPINHQMRLGRTGIPDGHNHQFDRVSQAYGYSGRHLRYWTSVELRLLHRELGTEIEHLGIGVVHVKRSSVDASLSASRAGISADHISN